MKLWVIWLFFVSLDLPSVYNAREYIILKGQKIVKVQSYSFHQPDLLPTSSLPILRCTLCLWTPKLHMYTPEGWGWGTNRAADGILKLKSGSDQFAH